MVQPFFPMPSNHDHCCVPGCTGDRRYPPENGIRLFHKFPSDPELRRKWTAAIRREEREGEFAVSDTTVVCSDHFLLEDYVQAEKITRARLAKNSVPRVFDLESWPKYAKMTAADANRRRATSRAMAREVPEDVSSGPRHTVPTLAEAFDSAQCELDDCNRKLVELSEMVNNRTFGLSRFKDSPGKMNFYAMLSTYASFMAVATFLNVESDSKSAVVSHRSKAEADRSRASGGGQHKALSLLEQIFMTVVRLRRCIDEAMLADLYYLKQPTNSRMLNQMTTYLYLRLGFIPIWPSAESVQENLPQSFKDLYPSTLLVIDVTEVKCEVSSSLPLQSQLYGSYKRHTTLKGLPAITPDGAMAFIAQLYGGSISDREIVVRGGFLDLLKISTPGLSVMADKGFDIQDLLIESGMKLNIPPFKVTGQQMSAADVLKTQQIAKLRIHVERLIQ